MFTNSFPRVGIKRSSAEEVVYLPGEDDVTQPKRLSINGFHPQVRKQTWTAGVGGGDSLSSLKISYDRHVRPLMDTIDLIRSLGLEGKQLSLPKIVVIGDQSVGKSSCLEGLSGVGLPRGNGIVTRVPLEMRMRTLDRLKDGSSWKCQIHYITKDGKVVDKEVRTPAEVADEVREAQHKITGDDSGISDGLITLDVQSPDVPDLTLIDLPGIARFSEENPQIEEQIENLIVKYIRPINTVILAVFPAGTDVDTVAAFRLARDADPTLERTMGVMTKLDLVDRGSEKFVIELLNNKKVHLGLGIYGVKCRSQEDLEMGIPLSDARKREDEFFRAHAHFGQMDASKFTIDRVSERMVTELITRIRGDLPDIMRTVSDQLVRMKHEKDELGHGPSDSPEEKKRELIQLLTDYTELVLKVSSGEYRHQNKSIRLFSLWRKETHKFAQQILEITETGVAECLKQDSQILHDLQDQRGNELPDFVNSFPVCESIIEILVDRCSTPATEYLSNVSGHVEEILRESASHQLQRYPKLAIKVKTLVDDRHQEALAHAEEDIRKLFEQESVAWTQDITYFTELKQLKSDPAKVKPSISANTDDLTEWNPYVEGVMDGTKAYIQVARRRIMDTIPQTVHYYLLKVLPSEIKKWVLWIASNPDDVDNLYEERLDIAEERERLERELEKWRAAEKRLASLS